MSPLRGKSPFEEEVKQRLDRIELKLDGIEEELRALALAMQAIVTDLHRTSDFLYKIAVAIDPS